MQIANKIKQSFIIFYCDFLEKSINDENYDKKINQLCQIYKNHNLLPKLPHSINYALKKSKGRYIDYLTRQEDQYVCCTMLDYLLDQNSSWSLYLLKQIDKSNFFGYLPYDKNMNYQALADKRISEAGDETSEGCLEYLKAILKRSLVLQEAIQLNKNNSKQSIKKSIL